MADTTITGERPATVEVTTSESTLTLDPNRTYTLLHLGVDTSNAAATGEVYGDVGGDRAATLAADADKMVLQSEKAIVIGPGLSSYNLITASDSPVVQVIPGDDITARLYA